MHKKYVKLPVYTVNKQINIIFINQIPNHIVFKKVHFMLVYKLSTVYHPQDNPQEGQGKINAVLRKYLNTHCFYFADELFM